MSEKKAEGEAVLHVPAGNFWDGAWKYAAIFGAVGGVLSLYGATSDPHRFAFSWLFAFSVFLTLALGSLFFVLIQHLTVAGWSVTVRRTAEVFSTGVVALAVLFVPIILSRDHLYSEWTKRGEAAESGDEHHSENWVTASKAHAQQPNADVHANPHAAPKKHDAERPLGSAKPHDNAGQHKSGGAAAGEGHGHGAHHDPAHALHAELLEHKAGYLNVPFWLLRAAGYFALWIFLALFYFRASRRQDESKDMAETRRMQSFAPGALILFGTSLTFAVFDWLMALEAAWYSTIFGVCIFAGAAVSGHALLVVMSVSLRKEGLLGDFVNKEHLHDLGKLTFGFVVFWAYVSFSQLMLIWYAGIPEEAVYYHLRWGDHGWTTVSVLLLLGHFIIPFFFLLSRNIKRRVALMNFGAGWLLLMHVLDMYWYVMPHYEKGVLSISWIDAAALLAVGGTYLAFVFSVLRRVPLVPLGDPRLPRAVHFSNA